MSEVTNQRVSVSARPLSGIKWGRVARYGAVGLLLLAAGALIALSAERLMGGSAPNEVRVTTFQDWRVICPPLTQATPNCALTADTMRDTGGVLLTLTLTDPTPGSTLSITVPHGVLLEPGLGFTIANEPVRIRPYETCTLAGCIALVTVDADMLKSLTTNMAGQVGVAAPNSQQPVNIPFSLRGFAEGYSQLQRAKSRRSGVFSFLTRS